MPDLILTFTAAQITRIKNTLGATTAAEMQDKIKAWIKAQVTAKARAAGQQSGSDAAEAELANEGW